MNERIQELARQAFINAGYDTKDELFDILFKQGAEFHEKFAELIVQECLSIVKSNTYGPAGEHDYSYSDENAAADDRAETIYKDITYRFGVEE